MFVEAVSMFDMMMSKCWWFVLAFIVISLFLAYLKSPKQKGLRGEKRVKEKLKQVSGPGQYSLYDVYLPLEDGTTTQIDHILLTVQGIFVIETKNYSGWIFGGEKQAKWTQSIYRKKSTFQNPLFQNYAHICALSNRLAIPKVYFHNVVVFVRDCEFKTQMPSNVVRLEDLPKYIKSFTTPLIKEKQLFEIADAILAWEGTVSKEQRAAHVQNLRARNR